MLVILLLACPSDPTPPPPPGAVDLVTPLGPGAVRAGVITDERALFGGISAEGRAGDVKMYNDRVQFVIQAVRPGSYYVVEGGGVLDADVVRTDGALGRDVVEEWAPMFGLGRILFPESVEVVSDGTDGAPAVVRVRGYEGALGLLEGAVELPGIIPDFGLELTTEYVLAPDSWLLEVRSTATATTESATFAIGDVLIGADEVTSGWVPGVGLGDPPSTPRPWSGYQGDANDVALGLGAPAGESLSVVGYDTLEALVSSVVGAGPTVTIAPGESTTWTRWYGVGPDLATVSAAFAEAQGVETQAVEGVVTAADGPVAGARVVVDLDGSPYTVAVTGADGRFSTRVPLGAARPLAVGRGPAKFTDLPPGAAFGSPYAAAPVRERALASLSGGAAPIPQAEGRGVASADDPLTLGVPATVVVRAADGLPFTVRIAGASPVDEARVQRLPDGLAAAGWSRDGELSLPVEPGTYELLVHRGQRFELHQESITVSAGETRTVDVELPAAFDSTGWVLGDPHSHASPSSDGGISMEDRLIVTGAVGIQVHFGTDHDHLADYRPLLAPLGLDDLVKSVVSDEVSPPLRGHFNIYPVEPTPGAPDNGAWTWWTDIPESTEQMVDTLRARHGDGFVLQSNHPLSSGLGTAAGWSPGTIATPDKWTDRFEAVEVLNSGGEEHLAFWLDVVSRGLRPTPVGVSDSHDHFGGSVGWSATWFAVDGPVTAVTDEMLVDAIRSGRVVPSRGPLLVTDPLPGEDVPPGTTIRVESRSASWVRVDRLRLLRDGVEVEVVTGTEGQFTLAPEADAWYAVVAEGDTPMTPVSGRTPWALAGPWRVDVGADGWTPPAPALVVR